MRTQLIRTISAIMLFTIATMFSGMSPLIFLTRSVNIQAGGNHCNTDAAQGCPLACTKTVCPLCVCVIGDALQPIDVCATLHSTEFQRLDIQQPIPGPFVDEIFHPPRFSKYA